MLTTFLGILILSQYIRVKMLDIIEMASGYFEQALNATKDIIFKGESFGN